MISFLKEGQIRHPENQETEEHANGMWFGLGKNTNGKIFKIPASSFVILIKIIDIVSIKLQTPNIFLPPQQSKILSELAKMNKNLARSLGKK